MGDHGASDFGKELGLIQEAVVTGRKLGAGKEFWAALAHDSALFQKVIDFVEAEKTRMDLHEWIRFYEEVFGVAVDLTGLQIPEKCDGFNWLIVMLQGMTANRLFDKCKERFGAWRYTEDLNSVKSVRTSEKTYAIRVRDRIEADEENKNKSANDCDKEHLNGITLEERLLLELFYHWRTGKHLDISNWTLCSGSRGPHGSVPRVFWSDARLCVHWYHAGLFSESLRSRAAVPLES